MSDVIHNPLHSFSFYFDSKDLPNGTLNCQTVNLPGVSLQTIDQTTPFVTIKHPGSELEYSELSLSILIDHELKVWTEIVDWMQSLAPDKNFSQYGDRGNEIKRNISDWYANATLTLLTPKGNPFLEVEFVGLFPTGISDIEFDTKVTEPEPIYADVTFAYTHYEIKRYETQRTSL